MNGHSAYECDRHKTELTDLQTQTKFRRMDSYTHTHVLGGWRTNVTNKRTNNCTCKLYLHENRHTQRHAVYKCTDIIMYYYYGWVQRAGDWVVW